MVTLAKETIHKETIHIDEINKVNGFTPRVQKLKQMLLDAQSVVCADRAWYMMESHKQTEGEHEAKRKAKAFANVLDKMEIAIRDGELIVGAPTPFVRGAHPNVEWGPYHLQMVLKMHKPSTASAAQEAILTEEDKEKLIAACEYWNARRVTRRAEKILKEFEGGLARKLVKSRMQMMATGDGAGIPVGPGADYDMILAIGFGGFINKAREHIDRIRGNQETGNLSADDEDKIAYLEAVIIALEGAIHFAERHAELAREMAEKESNPERKKELEKIAEMCEWVPAKPARSFYEALQTYWFVAVCHDIEKAFSNAYVGRFDQYMWPYYIKDINEGRITRQEAAELLGCLFVKWATLEPFLYMGLLGERSHQDLAQANYIANVTLGGVTRRGHDAANELSCLVLQVAKQVKTHQPHISIRWHQAMAPEFLDKAIECNRDHGAGIPAWFSDRVGTEYLLSRGVEMEDARDWAMLGCINTGYQKSFAFCRGAGINFLNHAKLLEMALNNGVDPWSGEKLGLETGDPRDFQSFEDVVEAYRKQIDYHYDFQVRLIYKLKNSIPESDKRYFPFMSAFLQDCIEKAKDVTRGGGRYQSLEAGPWVDRGIQDATDSLIAIKKVIFEEKKATMEELLEALKADFEGYEDLRKMLLAAPKYGNDMDEPDELMKHFWEYTVDKCRSYRDPNGERFTMYRQGAAWSTWAGKVTGALPNGRKAGTSLADASVSPMQGADKNGPTAVMNSVTKLDCAHMEGPLLNMKLAPQMLMTKQGKKKFADLLATYFAKGGNHVQFNIFKRETLLDAKEHPENYRDLVVRVAGYSAFWTELMPVVQDEIISRTEQEF